MLLRLLPALLLSLPALGQGLQPTLLTELDPLLYETSGLLVVEDQIWTHGDSGNPPVLYRLDPATGNILRQVAVSNATNVDCEEVTTDGTWVYVGDFGNNAGNRTNLRIYRFPLAQLLDDAVTSVLADTIRFAYADQTDLSPPYQAHNWDCEAFIAMGDSLYLFTKNWGDFRSYVYALPATPGDHLAMRRDTLESMGLITGSAYDEENGVLALIGYTVVLRPFVWRFSDFDGTDFFGGTTYRHEIDLVLTQTEAIAWTTPDRVYFSNEAEVVGNAKLWELYLGIDASVAGQEPLPVLVLHPNPATDTVRIAGLPGPAWVALRDEKGAEVHAQKIAEDGVLRLPELSAGLYFVEVETQGRLVLLRMSVVR
jgi:hypothetical protein